MDHGRRRHADPRLCAEFCAALLPDGAGADARGYSRGFAAVGVNSILALVLLAASSLLSLISYSIFTVMSVLILLAWLVSFYLEVFQVFSIRMNIVNMTVLILGLTVTFFAVTLLRDWFFSARCISATA